MKTNKKNVYLGLFIVIASGFFLNLSFIDKFKKQKKGSETKNSATVIKEDKSSTKSKINDNHVPIVNKSYPNFVQAAKIATTAVVHIKSIQSPKVTNERSEKVPFKEFLEKFFGEKIPEFRNYTPQPKIGVGSGVILTDDGYIITNNHVINNADKIEVTLYDNAKFKAKIIGQDASTDLAVLKIEKSNLPYLSIGNSDAMQVGDWVLAVGNPVGLNSTVTAGIISAKNRSRANKMEIGSFIQTDAAINMGNSGGALVNMKGELIGINTAIAIIATPAFSGYGFAIPSKMVRKVLDDIVKFGSVQRGILDIMGLNVTMAIEMLEQPNMIEGLNKKKLSDTLKAYKKTTGILVVNVTKNKAAYEAGLKPYDIIVGINDKAVDTMSQLQEILLGEYKPGDKIKITYYRRNVKKNAVIVLGTKTKYRVVKDGSNYRTNDIEGAIFENLTSGEIKKYKLKGGVKIKSLTSGKWQEAGIRNGFIITSIVHLDELKLHVEIDNIKTLCQELNKLSDNRLVVEGFYPMHPKSKKGYLLYW